MQARDASDAGPTAQGTPTGFPRVRTRLIFATLMLVILLAALDATILASALPVIVADLNGLNAIAWVTTSFMLAQIAVAPTYGKLGDIYGRKRVLQLAVIVFMTGSVLCGVSHTMLELVASRAVQGAGAGGLLVLVQAVVGDIVAPRERAKYQTLFGAVFGVASVAGPLLGGFLVEQLSWRWIFFVNLPLGFVAVVVLALVLPASTRRPPLAIDYLGAVLLAATLTTATLLVTLSGDQWAWTSPQAAALAAGAAALGAAFVLTERRAHDPILPRGLAANSIFRVAAVLSALLGCVMFSVVTFTPLFFQVVQGDSATTSGLRLAAMMVGIIAAGFVAGQRIARTGRYRRFPIVGFSCMTVGLAALATVRADTGTTFVAVALVIFGSGLGMTMQILVTAVQNSVPHEILGSATSAVTVVRGMGNALGPALLGAIFTARLGATERLEGLDLTGLPPSAAAALRDAYVSALRPVYLIAAVIAGIGVLLARRLEDRQLRATVTDTNATTSTLADIEGALRAALSAREREQFTQRLAERARVPLTPATTWALVRIGHYGLPTARAIAAGEGVPLDRLQAVDAELRAAGLLTGTEETASLSAHGEQLAAQAAAARRELVHESLTSARATPDEIRALLGRLAAKLPEGSRQSTI